MAQRDDSLRASRAMHEGEVAQLKALSEAVAAQRERQFGELVSLEKERGAQEMAQAKAPRRGQSGRLGAAIAGHQRLMRLHLKARGCPPHS